MRWLLTMVIAATIIAFAGCSGGGNDEESPRATVVATATEENTFDAARRVEADDDPSLPGEFVDLQTIYGGYYGSTEGPNTASHVMREIDYATEQGLPPAGGPHWGSSACGQHVSDSGAYCGPVQWGIYRPPDFWEPESLVHSMEHGGLVVWYNTTDQQVIDELEALVMSHLNDSELIVMTPFQEMAPETIALTSWGRRDKFPVNEYTKERVETFLNTLKCRFDPEHFCS